MTAYTSRISGFYRGTVDERLDALGEHAGVGGALRGFFADRGGGLSLEAADRMSENVIGVHGLPLGVALNFLVNGVDHVVPMAVEEASVVAAASNAARMVRESGGFHGHATAAIMTGQVQFDGAPDPEGAAARVMAHRDAILKVGDESIPRMVERGYGCRDLDVRVLDAAEGVVVVHVYVDVGDAMGANMVDTVAEAVAPALHELIGGIIGLRILSNLPSRRRVSVRCDVTEAAVGGAAVADGIARASRFAALDPYRACTHNKGFMNGLDAAAVALGQDWRSIEAGAHAWAATGGGYRPLSSWKRTPGGLRGEAELPLAVGTVGGSTRAHAGVRAAFELVRVADAKQLAVVLASVGLASNLAALRALAGEGIQQGHMRLHHRKAVEGAETEGGTWAK
ncbi:MAG: hydroxymethylglutaryl-CoA reductase, degradative [Deltaproteobacteria bacterium]|nr:hydroxymethylglutaryl-CoA reductase, degradative [Myxococcales bacterium]MDP3217178.1 hydroxymethylglutaryl-CoA reductase, degradative [Deltaproteobacteria bacterium]